MRDIVMPFESPMIFPNDGPIAPEAFGTLACCGKGDVFGLIGCCSHHG
jgi:hypothetical protein